MVINTLFYILALLHFTKTQENPLWRSPQNILTFNLQFTLLDRNAGTETFEYFDFNYQRTLTPIPKVITSLSNFIYKRTEQFSSTIKVQSINSTNCVIKGSILGTNFIKKIMGTVMIISSSIQSINSQSYQFNSGSTRYQNVVPLSIEFKHIIMVYSISVTNFLQFEIHSVRMDKEYITIMISSSAGISLKLFLISISSSKLLAQQIIFDYGSFFINKSFNSKSDFNLDDAYQTYSFILGINILYATTPLQISVSYNGDIISNQNYQRIGVAYANFRTPLCNGGQPNLNLSNGQFSCPCDPSCTTCATTYQNCTSCTASDLRQLVQSRCQCIFPFSDCRDSPSSCDPSKCSYLSVPSIKVTKLIKNPTKNSLTFYISILPMIKDFAYLNFSEILHIDLPANSVVVQFCYVDEEVKVEVDYFQNLEGYNTTISLTLNKASIRYLNSTPDSQILFLISPTNNLAANVYDDQIYQQHKYLSIITKAIVTFGFIVYFIGIFSSQLISSQMLAVVQISYFGLFIVNKSDPLIEPLNTLGYSNGYNNIFNIQQMNSPDRIYAIGYMPAVFGNINIIGIAVFIPFLLSFIFYRIHIKSPKWRIKMEKYWKKALGQYSTTALLLILYNFSCSFGVFLLSVDGVSWKLYINIFQVVLCFGLLGINIWLFLTKDEVWMGQYKTFFNWNSFCQKYYLIPMGQRFLVGILLSTANVSFGAGIASILVLGSGIFIVIFKKPFVQKLHMIRSVIHSSSSILILLIYVVISACGVSKGQGFLTYAPYGVVFVVLMNICFGFAQIVRQFVKEIKIRKNQLEQKKMSQQQQMMQMQIHRQTNKVMKCCRIKSISTMTRHFRNS